MLGFFVCLFPCLFRFCRGRGVCVQVMHVQTKDQPQGSVLRSWSCCVVRQSLAGTWDSLIRLDWLASKAQGSLVSTHPSITGITNAHRHTWLFMWILGITLRSTCWQYFNGLTISPVQAMIIWSQRFFLEFLKLSKILDKNSNYLQVHHPRDHSEPLSSS